MCRRLGAHALGGTFAILTAAMLVQSCVVSSPDEPLTDDATAQRGSDPTVDALGSYRPILSEEEASSRAVEVYPDPGSMNIVDSVVRIVSSQVASAWLGEELGLSPDAPVWIVGTATEGHTWESLMGRGTPDPQAAEIEGIYVIFEAGTGFMLRRAQLDEELTYDSLVALTDEPLSVFTPTTDPLDLIPAPTPATVYPTDYWAPGATRVPTGIPPGYP